MKLPPQKSRRGAARSEIIFAIFLTALSLHLITSIVKLMITLAERPGADDSMATDTATSRPGAAAAPAGEAAPPRALSMNPRAAPPAPTVPPAASVPRLPATVIMAPPLAAAAATANDDDSPGVGKPGKDILLPPGQVTVTVPIPLIYFDMAAITIVQDPVDDPGTNRVVGDGTRR